MAPPCSRSRELAGAGLCPLLPAPGRASWHARPGGTLGNPGPELHDQGNLLLSHSSPPLAGKATGQPNHAALLLPCQIDAARHHQGHDLAKRDWMRNHCPFGNLRLYLERSRWDRIDTGSHEVATVDQAGRRRNFRCGPGALTELAVLADAGRLAMRVAAAVPLESVASVHEWLAVRRTRQDCPNNEASRPRHVRRYSFGGTS